MNARAMNLETVQMLEEASALVLRALRRTAPPQQAQDAGAIEYDSWLANAEYDSWSSSFDGQPRRL